MPGCSLAASLPSLVAGRRKKRTREPSGDQVAPYSEVGLEVKSRTPPRGVVATSSVLPTPNPAARAPATKTMDPGPCIAETPDDPQADNVAPASTAAARAITPLITGKHTTREGEWSHARSDPLLDDERSGVQRVPRRGVGAADPRRARLVRAFVPRRAPVGARVDHAPPQARGVSRGVRGVRSGARRRVRRAGHRAAARRRRDRPAPRQDRGGDR